MSKQIKVGFKAKKSFTKVDKDKYLKNRIGIQVLDLDSLII